MWLLFNDIFFLFWMETGCQTYDIRDTLDNVLLLHFRKMIGLTDHNYNSNYSSNPPPLSPIGDYRKSISWMGRMDSFQWPRETRQTWISSKLIGTSSSLTNLLSSFINQLDGGEGGGGERGGTVGKIVVKDWENKEELYSSFWVFLKQIKGIKIEINLKILKN